MISAVLYSIWDNGRYARLSEEYDGKAPPEARLPPSIIGSVLLPIGLFWFAWTNAPSIHWIVPIIAGAPFGFGMVLVFLSIMNYLIDAYVIYAASVLAANSVLRSLFGAIFPLFTTCMFPSPKESMKNKLLTWSRYVPKPRHPLGILHPRLPRTGMRSFPIPLLQIRREDQNEV